MALSCKVGFHVERGSVAAGIGEYMRRLDAAGIPFCVKSVDDGNLVIQAARYARESKLPHNIVLRFSRPGGARDDLPDFRLPPEQAAREHWEKVRAALSHSPEIAANKDLIWIEPTHEIDARTHAEFAGWFSYHIGRFANDDGFKVALPGLRIGQPEPEHWRFPGFRAFLSACSERPEQMAVSVHEGKLGNVSAHPESSYPYLIGRFNWLFDACDELGFRRPTTFITEWTWSYTIAPTIEVALRDVAWLSDLAARHPSLRGIFLWGLGGAQQKALSDQLSQLIEPLIEYAVTARFPGADRQPSPPVSEVLEAPPQPAGETPIEAGAVSESVEKRRPERGAPRVQYERVYVLLPPRADINWVKAVADATWEKHGYAIGKSPDDAGIGDLESKTVIAINAAEWGPGEDGKGLEGFFRKFYPSVKFQSLDAATPSDLFLLLDS